MVIITNACAVAAAEAQDSVASPFTGVDSELVVRGGRDHAWAGWESDSSLIADWFDAALALASEVGRP